jgi:hypothetical protein
MCGKDTPHYIFIDVDSERFVDLLCDSRASESWIALLQFDDSLDELLRWAPGAWLSFAAR